MTAKDDLDAALEEIQFLKDTLRKASSPDRISQLVANANRFTGNIENLAKNKDFNREFLEIFQQAYKDAGGTGPVPKEFLTKATGVRTKFHNSLKRSSADLRVWTAKSAESVKQNKTLEAARQRQKQLRNMPRKLNQQEQNEFATLTRFIRDNSKGEEGEARNEATVLYRRKMKNGRYHSYEVRADHHFNMMVKTAESMHRNLGRLAAFKSQNIEYVIVSDGAGCGKKSHRDPEKANGQVWTLEEATQYPLAHPACSRNFFPAAGPPGSRKLRDQLKGMGLTGIQKTTRGKVQSAAKVATKASMVFSVGNAVITNPFTQRFIREMLSDSDLALPPAVRHLMNMVTSYAKREAAAFAEHGQRLGIATQQDFNRHVLDSFDEDLANPTFLAMSNSDTVMLRAEQARAIGVPINVRKDRLLEALDDYGDWIMHRDTSMLTIADKITERNLFREAREELYGEAAIQYHVARMPGVNMQRNWTRVGQDLLNTYRRNPDRAAVEAVKLFASVINPTPWMRINLPANMKFMVGMPVRARQDIAVKLYAKATGKYTLTQTELRWARQLGMDLTPLKEASERFSKDDIISLLAPRLSWAPGHLFQATINMENGIVRPAFRVFPYGTYSRFFDLETRLGQMDVKEFIKNMRRTDLPYAERLREALGESIDPTLVTAVNLFRHSPVQTSLYLHGLDPQGMALKLLPDNRFLTYAYRVSFDQHAVYNAMSKEDLVDYAMMRGLDPEDFTKKQLIEQLNALDKEALRDFNKSLSGLLKGKTLGQILDEQPYGTQVLLQQITDGWQTGLHVLPGRLFGFTLNNMDIKAREVVIQLRLAGYSLLRISKETRYGYDSLLEWVGNAAEFVGRKADEVQKVLSNINGLDDLKAYTKDFIVRGRLFDKYYDARDGVRLTNVDQEMLDHADLRNDMEKFTQVWQKMFPGMQAPGFKVSEIGAPLHWRSGDIYIRRDVMENWTTWAAMRRKGVLVGHFPADTSPPVASLFHEAAHGMINSLSPAQYQRLQKKIIAAYATWGRKDAIPSLGSKVSFNEWFFTDSNQKYFARRVSGYATTSWDELIAEAFSEYVTSSDPGRIAKVVGEYFMLRSP